MARHVFGDLLSFPHLDFAGFDQALHHAFKEFFRHASGTGDAASMQIHMILLYAVGGQGAQGGEVLRQTDHTHNTGQFRGIGRTEQAMVYAHAWVGLQRPAHGAHFHRYGNLPNQIAFFTFVPAGKRLVATAARGVGVGGGFDSTPVVAGGQCHGIDTIHNALVMSRGAVGVG